jgi:hypothetical protein
MLGKLSRIDFAKAPRATRSTKCPSVGELISCQRSKIAKVMSRIGAPSLDVRSISSGAAWEAFPVEDLHAVEVLCGDQRDRFLAEAALVHVQLTKAGV